MTRIANTFRLLQEKKQSAFITFLMAGDPDFLTSLNLIKALPINGVDIIEIGMPFSDPMADGPLIQKAGQRSISTGMNLEKVFELVRLFRVNNSYTPIILMGYYNPIYAMGVKIFLKKASDVGVDGLIIVDLPPEEDEELCIPAQKVGIDFIRLATPTTDSERLKTVLKNTSGFIYYVSVNGVTGGRSANPDSLSQELKKIKETTSLPVCVGFGIKTDDDARVISKLADGVVVGSSIVELIEKKYSVKEIHKFIKKLAEATHGI